MHLRRAGSHDDSVQAQFSDVFFDDLLTGIGAGIFIGTGDDNARQVFNVIGKASDIDSS